METRLLLLIVFMFFSFGVFTQNIQEDLKSAQRELNQKDWFLTLTFQEFSVKDSGQTEIIIIKRQGDLRSIYHNKEIITRKNQSLIINHKFKNIQIKKQGWSQMGYSVGLNFQDSSLFQSLKNVTFKGIQNGVKIYHSNDSVSKASYILGFDQNTGLLTWFEANYIDKNNNKRKSIISIHPQKPNEEQQILDDNQIYLQKGNTLKGINQFVNYKIFKA